MKDHSELFARALAGELNWNDELLERLRHEDPGAARELDDLLALQAVAEIDAGSAEALEANASDDQLIAKTLAALQATGTLTTREASHESVPTSSVPKAPAFARTVGLAAAALVLIVAGLWWSSQQSELPQNDFMLGDSLTLVAVSPIGPVDDFVLFEISGELAALEYCELRVWSAEAAEGTEAILTKTFLGSSWEPSTDERGALPRKIRWELRAFDKFEHQFAKPVRAESERRAP